MSDSRTPDPAAPHAGTPAMSQVSDARIRFRVPVARRAFWQTVQAHAKAANLSLEEWLYQRLTDTSQPLPVPDSPGLPPKAWIDGWRHGRRQGWQMAQLDAVFGQGSGTLDRAQFTAWVAAHPTDWEALTLWIAAQPWSLAFQAWWGQPLTPAADHRRQ